jgi:hypothetical protein
MLMAGDEAAMDDELDDAIPEGETNPASLALLGHQLNGLAGRVRSLRYHMLGFSATLSEKVLQLKELVAAMDKKLTEVVAEIDAEIKSPKKKPE